MAGHHQLIIIPGLGNHVDMHVKVTKSWNRYGIVPHIFDAKWATKEPQFDEKLRQAIALVDSLARNRDPISVLGNSAGSSLALNIFGVRTKIIHRVIINCGRIRTGDWPWFTFNQATATSPSFRQSVLRSEETERTLSPSERKKILTIRPLFDEIVPSATVSMQGARNDILPTVEHGITIALVMTVFYKKIIDFIQQRNV